MIKNKQIAKRYAKAFLHDNLDMEAFDTMIEEIGALVRIIREDSNFREFIVSPINTKEAELQIFKSLAEKLGFTGYTTTLLEILIRKSRMPILESVYEELLILSDRMHNRVRVRVTTAVEPSVAELKEMSEKINAFLKREAIVERRIDPSIIGGFTIEGDGKLIDMSVRGQITRALSKI